MLYKSKICILGAHANFCGHKKVCDESIERKNKERKIKTGTS